MEGDDDRIEFGKLALYAVGFFWLCVVCVNVRFFKEIGPSYLTLFSFADLLSINTIAGRLTDAAISPLILFLIIGWLLSRAFRQEIDIAKRKLNELDQSISRRIGSNDRIVIIGNLIALIILGLVYLFIATVIPDSWVELKIIIYLLVVFAEPVINYRILIHKSYWNQRRLLFTTVNVLLACSFIGTTWAFGLSSGYEPAKAFTFEDGSCRMLVLARSSSSGVLAISPPPAPATFYTWDRIRAISDRPCRTIFDSLQDAATDARAWFMKALQPKRPLP